MANYLYADDGNIHTRFTELASCTLTGIEKILARREGLIPKFDNESTRWGADRHDLWAEESQKTRTIPKCFNSPFAILIDHIEKEFATEILPGVIVHSRPDAVSVFGQVIIDYKTLVADNLEDGQAKAVSTYQNSRQLKFYAYQLGLHGIRIKRGIYFVEIWDKKYSKILGYQIIVINFDFKEIASILPWVKERIGLLVAAYDEKELAEA